MEVYHRCRTVLITGRDNEMSTGPSMILIPDLGTEVLKIEIAKLDKATGRLQG